MMSLLKNKLTLIGFLILLMTILGAALAPLIADDPARFQIEEQLLPPSPSHPLGQDEDGRDLLTLVLSGARTSLTVSLLTVLLSGTFGTLFGVFAGFFGGKWNHLFLLITDAVLAFPSLLLIIALAAFQREGSIASLVGILSAVGWVSYARLARGQVLSLKSRDYVLAAQSLGASFPRLCFKHLIPNLIGPILVNATFATAGIILAESTLSFLGLGLPPDIPSWGRLLDQGVQYLLIAPHLSLFPGLAIGLTILAFNLVGEGLRDYFDVKEVGK